MKKGNLPTQEYTLINVCIQTIESGTPLICDDCGRTIFNIATIKGKSDGKTYNVGLSCVEKLRNKTIYFDSGTLFEYESLQSEWKAALNSLKWLKKQAEKAPLNFRLYKYDNGIDFSIELEFAKDFQCHKKGWPAGHTQAFEMDKLPLFAEFVKA